jgi:hypothetical protein
MNTFAFSTHERPRASWKWHRSIVLLLGLAVLFVGPVTAARADSTTQLPFTSGPVWLAVDAAAQHVFVSGGPGTSSIVVLNWDGTVVKTITGEQGASQMAVADPRTHTLYVALHDANAISEIDTQTLTETTRFSTAPFASPTSLVIAGPRLWFSCSENGVGCVASAGLDGSGIGSADLQGIGSTAEGTALASGCCGVGNVVLAVGARDSSPAPVAVYNVAQDPPYPLGSSAEGCPAGGGDVQDMAVDPPGLNLLLACSTPNYVAALSTSNLAPAVQYPIGASPDSVALSSDGTYVAVGRKTTAGPDIGVYGTNQGMLVRTFSLETQDDLPAHALAWPSGPGGLGAGSDSVLFAVVFDSSTGHMDFHVLDWPAVNSTVSLTPPQQWIRTGETTTLTAQVSDGTTPAGTVDLYATPTGGSKTLLTTGTVGSGGTVSFTVSPTVATTYSAVLEAGPDYPSATSQDATVAIVPRSIPIAASLHRVTYGGKVKLKLTGLTTGTVDLFALPNGQQQVLVKQATVTAGQESVTFTVPPKRTTAYFAEREDHAAASNNVTVSVRPLLGLAVAVKRVSPQVVRHHGEKVAIAAGRKPALPGEPLEIEIDRARSHGGWTRIARGNVPVGASGIVVLVGTLKKTGQYRTRASYRGDGDYTSAKSVWRRFRVG